MNGKVAYGVKEAAERIGVGRSTLYVAIKAGLLKTRKIGRRTLVLHEDLESFVMNLPGGSAS